jgi:hypothetical protein
MAGGLGLSTALSGLAGVYGGYKQGELDEAKIDDVKRSSLAKVAMGNALQLLGGGTQNQMPQGFGQQMAGGPQPPPPGQPSPPMQGGGMRMPPGGAPQGPPGMSPGGMPMPQPRPPGAGPQANGMMPGPPPGMGGTPPGGQSGPAPNMGGGPPGQQMGRQSLDWRQIVQAVQQSNPNIKPDVLAEAVNQFIPMMNQQSQMEWRMVSLQLREQQLQQREHDVMLMEQGRNQRADQASDDRRYGVDTRAGSSAKAEEGRDVRFDKAEEGRNTRADKARQQRADQFDQREARLQESLKFREDSTYQRLELQKQEAIRKAETAKGKEGLAQVRAIIDAQDKHIRTRIQAYSVMNKLKPDERKKMLDDADAKYNEEIAKLKELGKGGSSKPNPDVTVLDEKRVPLPVPKERENDPDGTTYDGGKWVKKGNQMVPQGD